MFPARFFPWKVFPRRRPTIPGASQKARIHNALLQIAALGVFPLISYNVTTGQMEVGDAATPASALANEVSGTFKDDEHWRRGPKQDRKVWRWRLYLSFHSEVSFEAFEEDLLAAPRWVPAASGLRQVQIRLVDVTYTHPQQHGAASGSQATYTFEASQSPA